MGHNFKELLIWKKAMKIVEDVYLLTKLLANEEKFELASQINRAVISIPSNIAEGSGRTSNKKFKNFLNSSISSSFELET